MCRFFGLRVAGVPRHFENRPAGKLEARQQLRLEGAAGAFDPVRFEAMRDLSTDQSTVARPGILEESLRFRVARVAIASITIAAISMSIFPTPSFCDFKL